MKTTECDCVGALQIPETEFEKALLRNYIQAKCERWDSVEMTLPGEDQWDGAWLAIYFAERLASPTLETLLDGRILPAQAAVMNDRGRVKLIWKTTDESNVFGYLPGACFSWDGKGEPLAV